MVPEQGQRPVYASDGWEIDLARRELRSAGVQVPLGGRAFEIVSVLVQADGDLVSKNDMMDQVWPGAIVEENALQVHIAAIRKALGADRGMLKTQFGRGYRLLGSWKVVEAERDAPKPKAPAPEAARVPQAATTTNIPAAADTLIGRGGAVQYLHDLLGAYRVVTLTGPGGIGKTALALEVARSLNFSGDTLLVEFASLQDPQLVPSAVASVLGLKLEGEETSPESVTRAVGSRKLLLVLDNCEHVIDATAKLAETIVSRCPGTTVLATSREVLRIDGEYVYRVPPLDVPPEDGIEPADAIGHTAVQLFMARARALGADLATDRDNLAAITAICRRLDGIPLAIELAAARSVMLGPKEVAVLLDDRFRLLTAGRRTALPRHQTLRAALDWSYNLLTEEEATVLRRLSIFAGDFPLEAVIAIAGHLAADDVASLVAKSLLAADLRGKTPHYRLLDTTRAYALEKLRAGGEEQEAARRHAEFYRIYFTRAEAESESTPQDQWLAIYGRHIDNVRAGLDWAFSTAGNAQTGIALTAAAVPVWVQMSLLGECRERVERAMARLDANAADADRLRMQLSAALGWSLMYGVGRAREAGPAWTTTLELADKLDDRDHRLRALWGLCINQFNNGEFRKALEFAQRFADVVAGATDAVDLMMADRLLATALHFFGDQNRARVHISRVLEHLEVLAQKPQIVRFRFDLRVSSHYFQARILWLQGFGDQALRVVKNNIEEGHAIGHALTFCSVLGQGACPVTFLAGDLDAAEHYCAALLEHTERHPIRLWNIWARCFKGMLMVKRGHIGAGLEGLRTALDQAGDARLLPRFLLPLGELAACLGEAGEAARGIATIEEALARSVAREEGWYLAELLRIKGELLRKSDSIGTAAAEKCFTQALEVARQQGAPFWELRTAMSLARLKESQNRRSDARKILQPVVAKFTEGFGTADLRDARTLLDTLSA
jgi:predicted ATPase/DNA-binding winged helix-turn-helix (wHTH) protein